MNKYLFLHCCFYCTSAIPEVLVSGFIITVDRYSVITHTHIFITFHNTKINRSILSVVLHMVNTLLTSFPGIALKEIILLIRVKEKIITKEVPYITISPFILSMKPYIYIVLLVLFEPSYLIITNSPFILSYLYYLY